MTAIANLNAVAAVLNDRYVAREEDVGLLARSIVAGEKMLIVSFSLA